MSTFCTCYTQAEGLFFEGKVDKEIGWSQPSTLVVLQTIVYTNQSVTKIFILLHGDFKNGHQCNF